MATTAPTTYTIPTSQVYRKPDGSRPVQWYAGDVIPYKQAVEYGLAAAWADPVVPAIEAGQMADNSVTRAALAADVAAAISPVGATLFFAGDSMTAQESSYASDASWRNILSRLVGDIASFGGYAAYGGQPIEYIHANALPVLQAMGVKPTLVNIMCGTNNRSTDTPEQAAAKLWAFHAAVQALGCLTVAYTIPPRSDGVAWTVAFNALVTQGAADRGIPLVDLHATTTVDPATGGWKSGLVIVAGDGIVHPNNAGCMEIAKLAAPVIRSFLARRAWKSPLPLMSVDATNLAADPLFLNTADGAYPTLVAGGVGGTRAAWSSYSAPDTTVSYVTAPTGIPGKMMKLVRSGTTSTAGARSSTSATAMPIAVGDEIEFGCVFRVQNAQSDTTARLGLAGSTSANNKIADQEAFAFAISQWRQNIDLGYCYQVFRVPASASGFPGMALHASLAGAVGSELHIGQLLIRNRTKAGLAPLSPA
jgi:lysophospholipase L1-like esterase